MRQGRPLCTMDGKCFWHSAWWCVCEFIHGRQGERRRKQNTVINNNRNKKPTNDRGMDGWKTDGTFLLLSQQRGGNKYPLQKRKTQSTLRMSVLCRHFCMCSFDNTTHATSFDNLTYHCSHQCWKLMRVLTQPFALPVRSHMRTQTTVVFRQRCPVNAIACSHTCIPTTNHSGIDHPH